MRKRWMGEGEGRKGEREKEEVGRERREDEEGKE